MLAIPFLLPMEKNSLYLIFQLEGRVADSFQWGGDFLPTLRTHPFPKIRPPGQAAQREQTQLSASANAHIPSFSFYTQWPGNGTWAWGICTTNLCGPIRPANGLALISCPPGPSSKPTARSDCPKRQIWSFHSICLRTCHGLLAHSEGSQTPAWGLHMVGYKRIIVFRCTI